MNQQGINQGASGNISVRFNNGMLITPSGMDYEDMVSGDIVYVGLDGRFAGKNKPSSEWRMHRDIYVNQPTAHAVLHAHPTFCVALSSSGMTIPAFHYMVAISGGKDIRCASYTTFGTDALSKNMLHAMADRNSCLLANHGMICFAANLKSVLKLAIEIETLARQYWHALQLGEPNILSDEDMDKVLEKFESYGQSVSDTD